MVMIEMREAAYDTAFDLLDELKELGKKKKIALCELEDAIWECYEASKDKESEESKDGTTDMEYRRRRGMRRGMRHEYPSYYDEEDDDMRKGYRSHRGMRGYRSERYSY